MARLSSSFSFNAMARSSSDGAVTADCVVVVEVDLVVDSVVEDVVGSEELEGIVVEVDSLATLESEEDSVTTAVEVLVERVVVVELTVVVLVEVELEDTESSGVVLGSLKLSGNVVVETVVVDDVVVLDEDKDTSVELEDVEVVVESVDELDRVETEEDEEILDETVDVVEAIVDEVNNSEVETVTVVVVVTGELEVSNVGSTIMEL